jgi:hypothetical protein
MIKINKATFFQTFSKESESQYVHGAADAETLCRRITMQAIRIAGKVMFIRSNSL